MSAIAFVRRRRSPLLLVVITAISLLMYSYARAADGTGRAVATRHRFTGAELVDGLVFLNGPAARVIWSPDLLTQFKDDINRQSPERSRVRADLTSDPAFLATFADEMQSGSPIRVHRAISGLGTRLRAAFAAVYGADRLAATDRVAKRYAGDMRRLTGSPDYGSGKRLRDFGDSAPGTASTGATAHATTPSSGDGNGSFIFSSGTYFISSSVFISTYQILTYDEDLGSVIVVLLAVILLLFIMFTLVYPVVVASRQYSAGLEQFRQEQFIATLARQLAVP
jgi:hypothetical protein